VNSSASYAREGLDFDRREPLIQKPSTLSEMRYNPFMKFRFIFLMVIALGVGQAHSVDDLTKDLEDHFRLYLIKPDKRSQGDRVTVTGDKVVIYHWKSLDTRKPDEVICAAYEWLLLGRTSYGKGAKEAFEKYSNISQIDLSFYDMEFGTKKGLRRAEILPSQTVTEYLRVGVRRDSLTRKSFNRKDVKKMIEAKQCVEVGKNYIDSTSINDVYIKGKK
jgi:hypothetical protein